MYIVLWVIFSFIIYIIDRKKTAAKDSNLWQKSKPFIVLISLIVLGYVQYLQTPKPPIGKLIPYPQLKIVKVTDTILRNRPDSDITPIAVLYPVGVNRLPGDSIICNFQFRILNNGAVENLVYVVTDFAIKINRFSEIERHVTRSNDILKNPVGNTCSFGHPNIKKTDSLVIFIDVSYQKYKRSKKIKMPRKRFVIANDIITGCSSQLIDTLKKYSHF